MAQFFNLEFRELGFVIGIRRGLTLEMTRWSARPSNDVSSGWAEIGQLVRDSSFVNVDKFRHRLDRLKCCLKICLFRVSTVTSKTFKYPMNF